MIAQNAQSRPPGGASPLSVTPLIIHHHGRPAAMAPWPLAWEQRRSAMRAWHVDRPGPVQPGTGGLRLRQTPVPEPGPGELLLRVLACGVCRTDLHVAEGDLPAHRPG